MSAPSPETLLELVQAKAGGAVLAAVVNLGHAEVTIAREALPEFAKLLKEDRDLDFAMLVDMTAVDWMDLRDDRFEMVYHFMSLTKLFRLRVKIPVPEEDPIVDTITPLWASANFMEREVWDMFGVKFRGHPDLRRVLLYDEFVGHPLRKDYPVQGKQPRVPMLNPEVRNTSLDMSRPGLVSINKRKGGGADPRQGIGEGAGRIPGAKLNSLDTLSRELETGAKDTGTTQDRA